MAALPAEIVSGILLLCAAQDHTEQDNLATNHKMFLPQCMAWNLLVLLLFQPSFGLVLSRDRRQAEAPPDSDSGYAGLSLRFADTGDYQELTGYSESLSEQRGGRGSLTPNFGKPLDRIFSEKRMVQHARIVPRRRMLTPLDHIGGTYLLHRRGWSEYPDAEWDFYEDELADSRTETDQQ